MVLLYNSICAKDARTRRESEGAPHRLRERGGENETERGAASQRERERERVKTRKRGERLGSVILRKVPMHNSLGAKVEHSTP